jgi:hypothetical protein
MTRSGPNRPKLRRGRSAVLTGALLAASAAPAAACEPVVPLARLFGGPGFVAGSLIALGAVVGLKTLLFVSFERRLRWPLAAGAMLLGNLLTSALGLLLALAAAAPPLLLAFVPAVFLVSLAPARRLVRFRPWRLFAQRRPALLASGVVLLYLATFFLFAAAQGALLRTGGGAGYWLLKLAYVEVGLAVSLFLTAAWEEAVVGWAARGRVETPYFLPTVLRANVWALLAVFAWAAIEVVPRRLASPAFLISWLGGGWP